MSTIEAAVEPSRPTAAPCLPAHPSAHSRTGAAWLSRAVSAASAVVLLCQLAALLLVAPSPRVAASALTSPPAAPGAGAPAPPGTGLRPFPADATPFDAAGRRELALDALTFFPRQQGIFPGRAVYQLPVADWPAGDGSPQVSRTWQLSVPGSAPLYLLAAADAAGVLDPSAISIQVDGAPLSGLEAYVHDGVEASYAGRRNVYTVLDLVFAPPPAGHYQIEVRATYPMPDAAEPVETGETEAGTNPAVAVYDLDVLPPDALGPLLLRDAAGRRFALLGSERRHVPNDETARLLGYRAEETAPASAGTLAAIPEGPSLPPLYKGLLLRADGDSAVFRLQEGRRVWLGAWDGWNSWDDWAPSPIGPAAGGLLTVPAPVLQTIPPLLVEGLLVRNGGPDLYRVDRQSLRKVPDWEWAQERGFTDGGVLYVPDRILRTLPEGAPYWVQAGGTGRDGVFFSAALGRPMPYRVFLPPGYDSATEIGLRYPVLYLLHGFSGRYDEWYGYGAEQIADESLADGSFVPALIVMPQGGLGYWLDEADGGPRWGEYVARDLVAHVDATYRTIPRREARAIGGLSMGGHGALQLAINYPDVFGVAGAHSPSIRSRDETPPSFGVDEEFARRDPLSLIAASTLEQPPAIWLDAGADDPWLESAAALHHALEEKGWAHEWHVYPGEHDGWYWTEHLWEYLPYYGARFRENGVAAPPPSASTPSSDP